MIRNERKGFTLIEILIVVAIIAILASVVLVGLGPTQQAGRDARRISDLREVQNGLELYYNKCGYYPGTAQSGVTCAGYSAISGWAALNTALTGSAIGLNNTIPDDPTNGTDYLYGAGAGGVDYVLGAKLENASNQALSNDVDGTVDGVNCADPIYCVQL